MSRRSGESMGGGQGSRRVGPEPGAGAGSGAGKTTERKVAGARKSTHSAPTHAGKRTTPGMNLASNRTKKK